MIHNLDLPIGNQLNCLGQDHPFCLFHHALLQHLGRIFLFYLYSFLENNRAGIRSLIYKMASCTSDPHTAFEYFLMYLQAIKSLDRKSVV